MLVAIAGITPALIPALQASRADIVQVIRRQTAIGASRPGPATLFVVAQIAGSTLFLAAALLFVRSFWNTAAFVPGFDTEHSLVLELNPTSFRLRPDRDRSGCSTPSSNGCARSPASNRRRWRIARRSPSGFPKNVGHQRRRRGLRQDRLPYRDRVRRFAGPFRGPRAAAGSPGVS